MIKKQTGVFLDPNEDELECIRQMMQIVERHIDEVSPIRWRTSPDRYTGRETSRWMVMAMVTAFREELGIEGNDG